MALSGIARILVRNYEGLHRAVTADQGRKDLKLKTLQQFTSQLNISQGGFPGRSMVKNLLTNAGDVGLIPGSGRSPGEVNSNPLQYSCLGTPMDQGAWQPTVYRIAKESDTTK